MRKTALFSLPVGLLAASVLVMAQQPAAPAKPKPQAPAAGYKSLKYPPLNKIKVPEPTRFELPNGMVVYLVEDHEIPLVNAAALVRAGSRWEPAAKIGLASITGTVMRSGGTAERPGDKLDEELDRLGAFVETGIGQDSGRASVSVLKEDLDKGLAILADILQHPAFPQEKIDLAKIAQRDAIARRNDNPQGIIFREFGRTLFGKDSPYARQTEYDTIQAITRDDLVAFHKQFFQPENMILGVWGDFQSAEIRGKIEQAFGSWARGGNPKPAVPEIDDAARSRTGFYSISRPDMEQSWVMMGMAGGKRSDPDYPTLEVMNEILGGGFSSRLFVDVRTTQGLAYAVFSSWNAGWDRTGTFSSAGSSKPTTTIKIYNSIKQVIEKFVAGTVTDDELARAKDSILKSAAFDSDSTGKIVNRLMTYEYYGYPKDFLQQYRAKVEKVSKADVARVARENIKTGRFLTIFLGPEKGYEAPLASLGSVSPIDVTIPQPKQKELGAATPEAAQKGKALLAAVREKMGGAALLKVKDLSMKGNIDMDTPQGPVSLKTDSAINLSGKMLNKMQTPMGEMTILFDGKNGWMNMGQESREMGDSQRNEARSSLLRSTIPLLQNFEKPGYTVQALGQEEFNGRKLEAVAVSSPENKLTVKVYVDPATNMIAGKQFTASIMGPPTETEELYSDYRDVSGVQVAFKTEIRQGGQKRSEVTAEEVKINPGVEDSAYQKR